MSTQIFVNLPVKDLPKSIEFFQALGYTFNPQFTDANAACLVISEHIFAMLLTLPMFQGFTPKAICDTAKSTEVLIALSCESRAKVQELTRKAFTAGATPHTEPKDHGFMYQHSFQDLDGHIWELFHMEPNAVPQ